jgi:Putative peptidoglycan binding domain
MSARGSRGKGDGDDWFDDVDPSGVLENDPPSAEDDWLLPPPQLGRARPELPWRRIAVVAGAAVAVLVAGLAAGGVFSSSGRPRALQTNSVTITTPKTVVKTTPRVAVLPSATLKPGDTGLQVRELQGALNALGYSVGKVDGQYGPATKTAVAAFQKAAGLTQDGVFGPLTLNALIHRAGP